MGDLREVEAYKKGWDDLKLPRGHKRMLKALVRTHLKEREVRHNIDDGNDHAHDLVRGKGTRSISCHEDACAEFV